MLKKLFKYDFLWIMKTMPYYYIAVLALGICTLFTNKMYGSHLTVLAWLIIDHIVSLLFILACFTTGITILIRSFMRFRNNLYKDESYLTHTLPVSKSALFASKVLASFTACTLTACVILAAFFITIAYCVPGRNSLLLTVYVWRHHNRQSLLEAPCACGRAHGCASLLRGFASGRHRSCDCLLCRLRRARAL